MVSKGNYWLYCKGYAGNRIPLIADEMIKLDIRKDSYSSLFRFDVSIKNHIDKHGGISGYQGNTYGDYFVLDFDTKIDDKTNGGRAIAELFTALVPLLDDLRAYESYFWFSGKKGFHLYIPKYLVKYDSKLDNNWVLASRQFAELIMHKYPGLLTAGGKDDKGVAQSCVDTSIYNTTRIFRYPYSQHSSTSFSKVPRKYIGYNPKSIMKSMSSPLVHQTDMLETIFNPKDMPKQGEIDHVFDLTEKIPEAIVQRTTIASGPTGDNHMSFGWGKKHCIVKMMNKKTMTGQRNLVALRLITHWLEEGMDTGTVTAIIRQWNNTLTEPLKENELQRQLKSCINKKYIFSCKDTIKLKFCSTTCPYYTTKDDKEDYVFNADTLTRKLVQHKTDKHLISLEFAKLYRGMDITLVPDYGHLALIVGGSSSG